MVITRGQEDTDRLRRAIGNVVDAARVETVALNAAIDECVDVSMDALRDAHRDELDAVQALLVSLELFERRVLGTTR